MGTDCCALTLVVVLWTVKININLHQLAQVAILMQFASISASAGRIVQELKSEKTFRSLDEGFNLEELRRASFIACWLQRVLVFAYLRYLPPKKPEKCTVAFNSSEVYRGVSLNDVLLTGPDFTSSLNGRLIRFRKERVAVIYYKQQICYNFLVQGDHHDFLRFLWFYNNDISEDIV